jgi:YegS/Rv2252/BmrU family lipid kinase
MDVAVVLNPRAGHGADEELQREIIELFAEHGREATVFVPGERLDVTQQARAAVEAGCRVLVAAGGDGTVNGVAQAAVGRDLRFGVLPIGTLNHFAKDAGIPLDLAEAVRVVAEGVERRVDVGEVNDRYFLNNSSIGVYPRIVELRHRYESSGLSKWVAALWASLAVLRRRPFLAVRIRVEDETVVRRTPFVFVGNNEYRMVGLRGAHRDLLTGGSLALYIMNAPRRVSLLGLAWDVLTRGPDQAKELDLFRVSEAAVETRRPRLQVALDGEVRMLRTPLRYRSHPLALRLMAPVA